MPFQYPVWRGGAGIDPGASVARGRQAAIERGRLRLAAMQDARAAEEHTERMKQLRIATAEMSERAKAIKAMETLQQNAAELETVRAARRTATPAAPGSGGQPYLDPSSPIGFSVNKEASPDPSRLMQSDTRSEVELAAAGLPPDSGVPDFASERRRIEGAAALGLVPSTATIPQEMPQIARVQSGTAMNAAQGFSLLDTMLRSYPNADLYLPGVAEALRNNDPAAAIDAYKSLGPSDQALANQRALAEKLSDDGAKRYQAWTQLYGKLAEVGQKERDSLRTFTTEERKFVNESIQTMGSNIEALGKTISSLEDIPDSMDTIKSLLTGIYQANNDLEAITAQAVGRDPNYVHIFREGWFGPPTLSQFDQGVHPHTSPTYGTPQDQAAAMERAFITGQSHVDIPITTSDTPLGLRLGTRDPGLAQPIDLNMPDELGVPDAQIPDRTPSGGFPLQSNPAHYDTLGSEQLDIPDSRRSIAQREWIPLMGQIESELTLPGGLLPAMAQVESKWNPNATSRAGARGLMQFMPETAADMAKLFTTPTTAEDVMSDPKLSAMAGGMYMSALLDHYDGDLPKALTAYNAGMGKVDRILRETGGDLQLDTHPDWKDEQRTYATTVMSYMTNTAPRLTAPTTTRTATTKIKPKDFTIDNTPSTTPAATSIATDTPAARIGEWERIGQEQVIPALVNAGASLEAVQRAWHRMTPNERIEWTRMMLAQISRGALAPAQTTPLALNQGLGSPSTPLRVTVTP